MGPLCAALGLDATRGSILACAATSPVTMPSIGTGVAEDEESSKKRTFDDDDNEVCHLSRGPVLAEVSRPSPRGTSFKKAETNEASRRCPGSSWENVCSRNHGLACVCRFKWPVSRDTHACTQQRRTSHHTVRQKYVFDFARLLIALVAKALR